MTDSLWGEEFTLPEQKEKTKKIINKISKPKELKVTIEKQLKNAALSLKDKLEIIRKKVLEVLGKQIDNVLVIRSKEEFHEYMNNAIAVKEIAIDTETNNSLDPVTCKIMGLCLYYPGGKQAYIPVNHRNPDTKELLPNQLTEQDIKEELDRICRDNPNSSYVYSDTHNGKFDYEVLKCTCDVKIPIDWDSLIGAKLINENEYNAGLKQLYIKYIDPDQEKYKIDELFEGVEYADVEPEIFALYAATDSLMTYKLKEYQMTILNQPENDKILKLANTVEMPMVTVIAEMQLAGMMVDQEYAKRLSIKFHKKLEVVDAEISKLLEDLSPTIAAWKLTKDATDFQNKKLSEKQYANAKNSKNYDSSLYTFLNGNWYKKSKCKLQQLDETLTPNSLASPTQLGILLYSILGCPIVNKEKPTATGEDELSKIYERTQLPLCELILKRREIVKLLSTYIDTIPELAKRWPDGRVRTHFNQYGAATGRLSSSDPLNFQNIPSHEKAIRMLFTAERKTYDKLVTSNNFNINEYEEIKTTEGWKYPKDLKVNDILIVNLIDKISIINIENLNKEYNIRFNNTCAYTDICINLRTRYRIVGGDFSAQEPRLVAHYSGDKNMLEAYLQGRDLYSVIASESFNVPYEDCLEFYPEGTVINFEGEEVTCGYKTHQNKEGKGRRTQAKAILLGILYGRGAASVGEQIGKSRDEAQEIIDKFFKAFPTVKEWINQSMVTCKQTGYVEDIAGRRRRLPDINLPKFTIKYRDASKVTGDFNPFLECENRKTGDKILLKYNQDLENARSKNQIEAIKARAYSDGIDIINNGGFISQAERQCVNARVQGGAATLTKSALLKIYNDSRLDDIKARIVNTVHDEILLEVPQFYSERAEELLTEDMVGSAKIWVPLVPMKTDTYNVDSWYADEAGVGVQSKYKKLLEKELSKEEAFVILEDEYSELLPEQIEDGIELGEVHIH